MQTILGANGQIAVELARELRRNYTSDLRLVSRNPRKIHDADTLVSADLLDAQQTAQAVKGSAVVYFTAGLPPDTRLWETRFPTMLKNALDACRAAGASFAYFDNTYMYPQDDRPQTEETPFAPVGPKGRVRATMASMALEEMRRADIPVLIGRAPEFYGPGKTQSFTNALIVDRLKAGKKPRAPVRDDTRRTLIWTPDASRALATLGNAPNAFGQTWHLPCCDDRPTYKDFVALASAAFGREPSYTVFPKWAFVAAGLFSPEAREFRELLPRYEQDNLFVSSKFKKPVSDIRRDDLSHGRGIDSSGLVERSRPRVATCRAMIAAAAGVGAHRRRDAQPRAKRMRTMRAMSAHFRLPVRGPLVMLADNSR